MNVCKRMSACSIVAVAALGLAACGGDDDETPAVPLGPPTLAITAVIAGSGQRWSPGEPATLVVSCEPLAAVAVEVETDPDRSDGEQPPWLFRPPGACGSRVQCGFVALVVQPPSGEPLTAQASASSITAIFPTTGSDAATLPNEPGDAADAGDAAPAAPTTNGFMAGEYRFFVELRTGNGQPFTLRGEGFSDEVTLRLELRAGCATSDAGTSDALGEAPADSRPTSDALDDDANATDASADAPGDAASDVVQG